MDIKSLNNKGLSLVEVVMAALLLSVVLAALFATYRNANNLLAFSRSELIALNWAESVIEDQKSDFRGAYTNPASPNWLSVQKGGTATVVPSDIGAGNQMKHLVVTINWTE